MECRPYHADLIHMDSKTETKISHNWLQPVSGIFKKNLFTIENFQIITEFPGRNSRLSRNFQKKSRILISDHFVSGKGGKVCYPALGPRNSSVTARMLSRGVYILQC